MSNIRSLSHVKNESLSYAVSLPILTLPFGPKPEQSRLASDLGEIRPPVRRDMSFLASTGGKSDCNFDRMLVLDIFSSLLLLVMVDSDRTQLFIIVNKWRTKPERNQLYWILIKMIKHDNENKK